METAQATAGWDRTLLALTSPRGYPLGEHRWVGASDAVVYEEQIHVPCLIRLPHDRHAGVRCQQLVQPPDLCASLREAFQVTPDSRGPLGTKPASGWRTTTRLPGATVRRRARRQRKRCERPLGCSSGGRTAGHELFAKPDDRWEANEVANRCPEAVEQLSAAWNELQQAAQSPQATQLSPLSELLLHGID